MGIQNIIKDDISINCLTYFDDLFVNLATTGDHLKVYGYFLDDPFYKIIPADHSNFILAQMNARVGKVSLPFHVDTRMVTPGYSTWSMQGYLAVDKISRAQGGLIVRLRSHLLAEFPDSKICYEDAVDLELNAGDFVIFSSQLHHATAENITVEMPWSILFTYRCWWCKPQYALNKLISRDSFNKLTKNQQLILGEFSQPNNDIYGSASARQGYD